MNYNITYRKKDNGLQVIISYKDGIRWRQKSKQGFDDSRIGKTKAKEWAKNALNELESSAQLNKEYSKITFSDFFELYVEDRSHSLRDSTLILLNSAYNHNFSDLKNIELEKVTSMDIQRCVNKMIEKGLSSSTISRYITNIKTIFNHAINKYNIIKSNPVINIEYVKTPKKEKKALNKIEVDRLLDKLSKFKSQQYYIASLLAVKCGLRLGEITGLTWSDIEFQSNTLTVNKQWKLNKGIYTFTKPKTMNSYRSVPFSTFVKKELLAFRKNIPVNFDNRIIKRTNTDGFSSDLVGVYKKIGFSISIHELRHTYATNLISNGMDFKTAAKLLGHNVEQTMNTYSHVNDDMINEARKIINNIF